MEWEDGATVYLSMNRLFIEGLHLRGDDR